MLTSIGSELSNARQESVQLQVRHLLFRVLFIVYSIVAISTFAEPQTTEFDVDFNLRAEDIIPYCHFSVHLLSYCYRAQGKLAAEKDIAIAAASEARMVSEEVLKEKEAALAAFQEVRQKSHELQAYLEKESPKLLTAMVVVQKERDTASKAAAEATSSAMKAGEVLAEVLGSFNLEMAKARHTNMQLQVLFQYLVLQ